MIDEIQGSDYMSMNFWRRYQIKQWLKRNKYDLNYSNETLTKNCHYQVCERMQNEKKKNASKQ